MSIVLQDITVKELREMDEQNLRDIRLTNKDKILRTADDEMRQFFWLEWDIADQEITRREMLRRPY